MPDTPSFDPSLRPLTAPGTDPQAEIQERLRQATLGEYDVLAQLGFGGMASVYLAHDLALDRRVAIKVMSPAMAYGAGLVERFRLEAKTAAALSHPNIIPIYAVREVDGLLFFVMKAIDGTSLDAVIGEVGPMPLPMVEAILAQAGGALGYAHRHGVVHRDVKPANILLDAEGWVVVTDFGIAKVADTSALTMTGVAVGTPTYMSPEQCSGDAITGASDQYSLGVVVFEMLTGRPPFVDRSVPALMIGHTTKPPPSIVEVRPDCPVALRSAVERMLAKDPADRFASVEDAVTAAEARPLAPDDATRGTLISLARNSPTRQLIAQVRTPRSPVPLIHRSGGVEAASPAPRRSGLLVAGGVTAGVAITALVALAIQRGPAPGSTPAIDATVSIASDSTAPVSAAAEPPSSVAPVVVPPAVLPPPATARAAIVSPEAPPPRPTASAAPAPAEAVPRTTAESVAPTRIEPPPVAAPAPAPAPAGPPPASAVDPRPEIEGVVQAYARALEAGRLDQAIRLFPTMPADQRQGLEAFYRDGGSMQTRWQVQDVTVTGSTATLRIVGSNLVRTGRTGASEQRVALRARLERGSDGWRLVALVN